MAMYAPLFFEAGGLTLGIAIMGITGSVILGLIVSFTRNFNIPIVSQIFRCYIEISRNTPLLIQLFFLYFGLPKLGIVFSPFACGTIGLIFLGGSYMAEAFRSGYESVKNGEIEAAVTLGMTKFQAFKQVTLPIGLRLCLPAIFANIIFLIKETSVFSAVSLMDLMAVAKDIIGMNYDTLEALTLLVISYLIILLPLAIIFSKVERRLNRNGIA